MGNAMQHRPDAGTIEQVLVGGDLSRLTSDQRVEYYNLVCSSVGLNPLTRPFDYITLSGKLTLYAKRDCTDQLRKLNGVSVSIVGRDTHDGVLVVTARATDKSGRSDESTGAVSLGGLKGEALANAMMKAETKAKRRVTLSICGLGMLDETEVDTVPGAIRGETTRTVVEERASLPALPPGVTRGMPENPKARSKPADDDPEMDAARSRLYVSVEGWTGYGNSDDHNRAIAETNAACKTILDALYGPSRSRPLSEYVGAAEWVEMQMDRKASYAKWLESQTRPARATVPPEPDTHDVLDADHRND